VLQLAEQLAQVAQYDGSVSQRMQSASHQEQQGFIRALVPEAIAIHPTSAKRLMSTRLSEVAGDVAATFGSL
jgi:hypothetical protein